MNLNYYLKASKLIKDNENLCYKFGYKNFRKMASNENTVKNPKKS